MATMAMMSGATVVGGCAVLGDQVRSTLAYNSVAKSVGINHVGVGILEF